MLLEWRRQHGDETVALVSSFLSTPFPTVRRTPISLLLRMASQLPKLVKLTRPRL